MSRFKDPTESSIQTRVRAFLYGHELPRKASYDAEDKKKALGAAANLRNGLLRLHELLGEAEKEGGKPKGGPSLPQASVGRIGSRLRNAINAWKDGKGSIHKVAGIILGEDFYESWVATFDSGDWKGLDGARAKMAAVMEAMSGAYDMFQDTYNRWVDTHPSERGVVEFRD